MKSINAPVIVTLKSGKTLKILQVSGSGGMCMPEHYSSKEAVIVVQKGEAILKMNNEDHLLKPSESFIIPAGLNHELRITENFQALVMMGVDSEVKFINT